MLDTKNIFLASVKKYKETWIHKILFLYFVNKTTNIAKFYDVYYFYWN
jgi:hypothetical protein